MDPISLVVGALAAGASAGLTDTFGNVIRDAYGVVKKIIADRYQRVQLASLEDNPESPIQQAAVKEALENTAAATDDALIEAARALLQAVAANAPEAARAVGVDLQRITVNDGVEVDSVRVRGLAEGVVAHDISAHSLKISGVDVDSSESPSPHP